MIVLDIYWKILLKSWLLYVSLIAPIKAISFFGRNDYYSFTVYNGEAVNEKIYLNLFRENQRTIKATLKLDKIHTTGYAKCKSATEVTRIAVSCGKKSTKCLKLLKNDIETITLTKGKKDHSNEIIFYCKKSSTESDEFIFDRCSAASTLKITTYEFKTPDEKSLDQVSNHKEPGSTVFRKAVGLFFLMDEQAETDSYKPSKKFFDSCHSGKEMGTLLVYAYQTDGKMIELRLNLRDVCEHHEPSFLIRFRHNSPVSVVEAKCEKPNSVCHQLIENDLHVMKLFYGEKNRIMQINNYFCKREKLDTGKYLYVRCEKELSTNAVEQKRPDEYVHMVLVEPEYFYFRMEKPIETMKINENKYHVRRAGENDRLYFILAPIQMVNYILIANDASNAYMTKFSYLREGSSLTNFCLDEGEKQIDNMQKFIQC